MPADAELDGFFRLFRDFLQEVNARQGGDIDTLRALLEEHLGVDPRQLPIVSDAFSPLEHPNLQLAIDDLIATPGTTSRLIGLLGGNRRFMGISLRDVLSGTAGPRLALGPVEYESRPVGVDESLSCVTLGLYLVSAPEGPSVVLVHGDAQPGPVRPTSSST